jgi:hypothetical protein
MANHRSMHPVEKLISPHKTSTCRSLGPHEKEDVQVPGTDIHSTRAVMARMRDLKLMLRIMLTIVAKGQTENDMRSDGDSNRFFDSLSG